MRPIIDKIIRSTQRKLLSKGLLRRKKSGSPLKWAIIGTGYMASVWADLLLESDSSELHCVCSRFPENAEAFRRKFGGSSAFHDLDLMLITQSDMLDFVYIATPLTSHYSIIRKCIEAGISVLSEKPVAKSSAEWKELALLATQNGVILIEGMWMRCLPTFRQAEEWVNRGEIGVVQLVRADIYKFQLSKYMNRNDTGGVLLDYGVYPLYLVCFFLGGLPDQFVSSVRYNSIGADTDWDIIAERGDIRASIGISSNFGGSSRSSIIGDKGIIEWSSPFNRSSEITLYNLETQNKEVRKFKYRNYGFEYQLAEVTQTLREGRMESKLLKHQLTYDTLCFAEVLAQNASLVRPT